MIADHYWLRPLLACHAMNSAASLVCGEVTTSGCATASGPETTRRRPARVPPQSRSRLRSGLPQTAIAVAESSAFRPTHAHSTRSERRRSTGACYVARSFRVAARWRGSNESASTLIEGTPTSANSIGAATGTREPGLTEQSAILPIDHVHRLRVSSGTRRRTRLGGSDITINLLSLYFPKRRTHQKP